jgi:hypothetical protein
MKSASPLASKSDILAALEAVLVKINDAFDIHYRKTFTYLKAPLVKIDGDGRKYLRVSTVGTQVSAYFFIDLSNGDVLKAASYKAPKLNFPRGNLFKGDVLSALTPHGVYPTPEFNLQTILDGK